MNFLEKLDFLMEKYGLNKRTLSQKSDIPYTTIDAWYKKGYEGLKLTTLRKLNNFFNTSLDFWILDEITDPNYGKSNGFIVDYDEMEHIKKFRFIEEHSPEGAKTVTYVLNREHTIAESILKLENKVNNRKNEDDIYAELAPEDLLALGNRPKPFQSQMTISNGKAENPNTSEFSAFKQDELHPPDMSAFNLEDRAAIKNGMKVLRSEKNGKTGKNWSI